MKILNGVTLTGTAVIDADKLIVGTSQLVASGGKIGIGTASPVSELHIIDSNPELLRIERSTAGNAVIAAKSTGGTVFFGKPNIGNFAAGPNIDLNTSPYFTIDSNGNFGVGTGITASAKLQVSGGDILLDNNTNLLFKTAAGATVSTINVTTANNLQINSLATNQYYASTNHQFYTGGGTERVRINSSGFVGIGTGATYPSWGANNTYNSNGLLNIKGTAEQNITLQTTDSNNTISKFFTGNTAWGMWTDGTSVKPLVIGAYQTEWIRVISDNNGANPKVLTTEARVSDKFSYGSSAGASAYTQYNATTKSIDFIFA